VLGSDSAKVALVEYGDFQCPYCAKVAREVLPHVRKDYVDPGYVLLAFRNFPLEFHDRALKAAESAYCAGRQGGFWPFHDLLYQSPARLDDGALKEYAVQVGVSLPEFNMCISTDAPPRVRAEADEAQRLRLTATPTFFAGLRLADGKLAVSRRIVGAVTFDRFREVLDGLIKAAGVK
jgi:protein-disulfide isomerase